MHQTNSLSIHRLHPDARPTIDDENDDDDGSGDFARSLLRSLDAWPQSSASSTVDALLRARTSVEATEAAVDESAAEGEKLDKAKKSAKEIEGNKFFTLTKISV